MTVEIKETGKKLEVKVRGRLDAMTIPDLEKILDILHNYAEEA